jgi:Protein of unknown function (DUF4240)
MDEATFWRLIEATKAAITPGASDQPALLQKRLEALAPEEIQAFDRTFQRLRAEAYRWDLWAAAYIIEGGCSDDGFMDFRAGLIGLGRDVFYEALRDPSTLAKQPSRGVDFSQEELAYAASRAYRARAGAEMPDHEGLPRPPSPAGERFDEDTVDERFPELAAKFGDR